MNGMEREKGINGDIYRIRHTTPNSLRQCTSIRRRLPIGATTPYSRDGVYKLIRGSMDEGSV